jgi:hypothetical protein
MRLFTPNTIICLILMVFLTNPSELISQIKRSAGEPCKFNVRTDTGIIYHNGSSPEIKGTTIGLCPGNSITFTLSYSGANCTCNPPQWKKNGVAIPNATTFIITVSDTGLYSVDIGCSPYGYAVINVDSIAYVKCLATGIKSNSFVNDNFLFYPNPVTSVLKITGGATENILFNVIRVTGETVLAGRLIDQQIDFSNLSDGIYFIELRNDNTIFTRKIIKIPQGR